MARTYKFTREQLYDIVVANGYLNFYGHHDDIFYPFFYAFTDWPIDDEKLDRLAEIINQWTIPHPGVEAIREELIHPTKKCFTVNI